MKISQLTVMASDSFWAKGVDHVWPSSVELHLAPENRHASEFNLDALRESCLAVRAKLLLMIPHRGQSWGAVGVGLLERNAEVRRPVGSRPSFVVTSKAGAQNLRSTRYKLLLSPLEDLRMPSRWTDTAEDAAENAKRKAEKEEKKRLKAEKQRKADEAQKSAVQTNGDSEEAGATERPRKRRRLSNEATQEPQGPSKDTRPLLRFESQGWQPCRSVERFTRLNHIEEGSYGFVSRAREEATGEIVAIKKLKLDPVRDGGFPVTALREIQCLNAAKHRHVVDLQEIVTGDGATRGDVYLVMEFLEHDLRTLQEDMD